MVNALVTGTDERTPLVAATLRTLGCEVTVVDRIAGLAGCSPGRSIHAYVQLAGLAESRPWAERLMERVEAVARTAPLLTSGATVVMVADGPDDPTRDPRVADALRLLTEAAVGGEVQVRLVDDASPATIAAALSRAPSGPVAAPLADYAPDLGYADWRTDVINLTSGPDTNYFGWVGPDGRPRVGALRGPVITPLDTPAGTELSWGHSGPGAHALAEAVLTQATGVQQPDPHLVDLFAKEVIDPIPADGFELTASQVQTWLDQQSTGHHEWARP